MTRLAFHRTAWNAPAHGRIKGAGPFKVARILFATALIRLFLGLPDGRLITYASLAFRFHKWRALSWNAKAHAAGG